MNTNFYETESYKKLNKYQKRAVLTKRKNVLVLASAGTGKTSTIVMRVKYLIDVCNVKPEEILCISFTNDAVNSLKEKLKIKNVFTFHKLALSIIGNKYEILSEDMLMDIIINSFTNKALFSIYNMPYNDMYHLVRSFINLFKSNNYEIDYFYDLINKSGRKDKVLLAEIMKCYICYDSYLKSEGLIDFNDMINIAIDKLDKKTLNYKYIIIDEFQDTSFNKFRLIDKIRKKCLSSTFFVGDDYQSIYRFTGADVNIILKIRKFIPFIKIYKLRYTYRFSKELCRVTKRFISKNPYQIRKNMRSLFSYERPVEVILYEDLNISVNNVLKEDEIKDVLILSRNNNDLETINISAKKMSVHKSKGLESDFVFLINVNNNYNGFPNKLRDHYILKYVNPYKEYYKYDEERRLFYVALTRCKKRIYIFAPKNNVSLFVKEILKYKDVFIRN